MLWFVSEIFGWSSDLCSASEETASKSLLRMILANWACNPKNDKIGDGFLGHGGIVMLIIAFVWTVLNCKSVMEIFVCGKFYDLKLEMLVVMEQRGRIGQRVF